MSLCNAKNHRWNCICGFGGAKRTTSPKKQSLQDSDLFAVPKVPRHYTKPNERCSFCDSSIFFRKLANGGKAYFDEPGFPWCKHPCLDQTSKSYLGIVDSMSDDWPQVSDISAEAVSQHVVCLSGRLSDKDWIVFLSSTAISDALASSACFSESFIQAHSGLGGNFDLAVLTPDLRRKLVKAYPTAAEVISEHM